MKLDDWLTKEGINSAQFARASGLGDRQLVHKYRHGERFPSPENLRRIKDATHGQVTAEDFVDQHVAGSPSPGPDPHRSAA